MQIDYLFYGVKGFRKFKELGYILEMLKPNANERLKILKFYDKFGLNATLEAFGISPRTLYRWKNIYEKKGVLALNPKSTKPKTFRKSNLATPEFKKEIKEIRDKYPNLGKERIYHLLKPKYENLGLKLPSISTIGRIISSHKDKMRVTPHRIDINGKTKIIKRSFKNRKPRNLQTKPLQTFALDTIQIVNNGIRKYILTMIDINTRIAYAFAIPSKHTRYTALGLKALIKGINSPNLQILTDNGSEFALHFKETAKEHNLTHYFTYPRSPKMNAHNERFNRTLQESFVAYNEDLLFSDLNEFNQKMAKWLIDYNTILPHSSLGYKSPIEYAIMKDKKCQMLWTDTKFTNLSQNFL